MIDRAWLVLLPLAPAAVASADHLAAPLALEVAIDGEARVGQHLPLTIHLRNTGAHALTVLPDLDGSAHGWRAPRLLIEVTDPDGQVVDALGSRCGNMNRLRASDFTSLAPGEALALPQWGHPALDSFAPDRPGAWQVVVTYDSHPDRLGEVTLREAPWLLWRMVEAARVTLRSEVIQLEVR